MALLILMLISVVSLHYERKQLDSSENNPGLFEDREEVFTEIGNSGEQVVEEEYNRLCIWSGNSSAASLEKCNATHHLFSRKSDIKNFVFLGDSTMARLYRSAIGSFSPSHKVKKVKASYNKNSPHCPSLSYFQLQLRPIESYRMPVKGIEGPGLFGLEHPFCLDMSGAFFEKSTVPDYGMSLEYLSIEHARDVSFQTNLSETSQETVALYGEREYGSHFNTTLCVVNSGLHDIGIGIPLQQYLTNVHEYILLLHATCSTILWLGISRTADRPKFKQRNDIIFDWNKALFDNLKDFPFVYVVDVMEQGQNYKLNDNVHYTKEYYVALAEFLFQLFGVMN